MFKVYYKIPLCYLSLHSDGKFLTGVDFCDNKRSEKNKDSKIMYGYKSTNSDLNFAIIKSKNQRGYFEKKGHSIFIFCFGFRSSKYRYKQVLL